MMNPFRELGIALKGSVLREELAQEFMKKDLEAAQAVEKNFREGKDPERSQFIQRRWENFLKGKGELE